MFLAHFVIVGLARIVDFVLEGYFWVVVATAVLSWVNPDPYNPIVRTLRSLTDPVLSRIRRRLPLYGGGIDFSPMVVVLAVKFLQYVVVNALLVLADRFPSS
jgi:YggT family protein